MNKYKHVPSSERASHDLNFKSKLTFVNLFIRVHYRLNFYIFHSVHKMRVYKYNIKLPTKCKRNGMDENTTDVYQRQRT